MSESGQAGGSGASAPTDLQQVLQLLMEDRRKREEEIAAERRQREEEVAAERERQERETNMAGHGSYAEMDAEVRGCRRGAGSDRGGAATEFYASRAPDLGEGEEA